MELSDPVDHLLAESQSLDSQGDLPKALHTASQALEIARKVNPAATARALVGVAKIRFRLGQYARVKSLALEARSLLEAHPTGENARVGVDILQLLGNCAAETNSFAEAEEHYRQASELGREIGYLRGRVAAMHGLANGVYFPRGQFELALSFEEETYQLLREHGLNEDLIFPLITQAMICLSTGQKQRAETALDELSRIVVPNSFAQGYCFCLKADLALKEDDLPASLALLTASQRIAEATGEPWLNIGLRLVMSRYQRKNKNGAAARDWAQDAFTFADRVGYIHEKGRALVERARAFWLCGDYNQAEADLVSGIEIFGELGAAFDLACARFLLAVLWQAEKKENAASAWLLAVKSIVDGRYESYIDQERELAFPAIAAHLTDAEPEAVKISANLLERLEAVPARPLRIITFGHFRVIQGKRLIASSEWKRRRAGELLRLLLSSPGRSLHRDQIFEALWPDRPTTSAFINFHQATSALRRILEPDLPEKFPSRYLLVEEAHVTIRLPAESEVDFEVFEAHVRNQEWEAALALCAGEPFESDKYQQWAAWKRQQLTEQYLLALQQMAAKHLSAGEYKAALSACQRILAEDPWQEQAALVAMQACEKMNDRPEAIRVYLKLAAALSDDLGIAPAQEIRNFYQSILS